MGFRPGFGAAVVFLFLLPLSCKQKETDPAATSDGPRAVKNCGVSCGAYTI